jgi:CcmD family protein
MSFVTQAQTVEMADQFRQDGKIYVVIAVVAVILAGIFIYLFRLDTKISQLEKQLKK